MKEGVVSPMGRTFLLRQLLLPLMGGFVRRSPRSQGLGNKPVQKG